MARLATKNLAAVLASARCSPWVRSATRPAGRLGEAGAVVVLREDVYTL